MKLTLTLLFIAISTISKAQKCKYDNSEYDKFQKIQKVEKDVKVVKKFFNGNGSLTIRLCKYGDNSFFRIYTGSLHPITVGKYDAIIFLLDNEETVKAYPDQIYSSDYNGERFLFKGTYTYEGDALSKIKSHSVKSIRLYYNDVYKEFDIKKDEQEDLLKTANCF